jgi:hypothetical protein
MQQRDARWMKKKETKRGRGKAVQLSSPVPTPRKKLDPVGWSVGIRMKPNELSVIHLEQGTV